MAASAPPSLRVAADVAGLRRAEDQVVVGGERDSGFRRHLGDAGRDIEVDRLDDDRVDALGNDVLGLCDLRLRVVLGRLHKHLVAGRLGGLLEERHVRIEVAESGLLLEHEGDFFGLARCAGVCSRCAIRNHRQTGGKRHCNGGRRQNPWTVHDFLPICVCALFDVIDNSQ